MWYNIAMNVLTYRIVDRNRNPLTGEEVRTILAAGLPKPAAKKALADARRSNYIGRDMVRVAVMEPEQGQGQGVAA